MVYSLRNGGGGNNFMSSLLCVEEPQKIIFFFPEYWTCSNKVLERVGSLFLPPLPSHNAYMASLRADVSKRNFCKRIVSFSLL